MNNFFKKLLGLLKKFVTVNIGYKIMAVIFAIILWLVVVNIQNPASTRTFTNIPVEIINEESVLDGDHIYTVKSGKNATITVAATRSVLSNLSASDFNAVADFSSLSITNAAPITVTLSSEKARYENQIDITLNTTSMVIDVEELMSTELPIQIHYIGTKPDDLVIDKIEMSPEKITVSAPQSIASTINSAGIMVNYADIVSNDPLELVPNLYDDNGNEVARNDSIKLSNDSVTAQFITYDTKTVPITIEPFGTPAEGYELKDVKMSRKEAAVKGPEDLLKTLEAIEIPSKLLNISDKTGTETVTIDLTQYIPDGMKFADVSGGSYYVIITAEIVPVEEETTEEETEEETTAGTSGTEKTEAGETGTETTPPGTENISS